MEIEGPQATALDPLGRTVHLTPKTWNHIAYGHPQISSNLDDVMRAVEAPTKLSLGRTPDEAWFYLEGIGPSKWLKVVVAYDEKSTGKVITAFPTRKDPR